MSYITLDVYKNMDPFIATKPEESYSKDLKDNIKMLSFFPKGHATPFGSFIYKIQKYPGDVDLVEEYSENTSVDEVINSFMKNLKRVVKDILSSKLHYFSEFKCGLDKRYDIDIGYCVNGFYDINPNLGKIALEFFDAGLFNKNEIDTLIKIIDGYVTTGDGYDIVFNIFRNRRVLRWTAEEILAGKKRANGQTFKLVDCLHDKTAVKIDVLLLYNNRFIEMTNFVALEVGGPENWINIDMAAQHNLKVGLPIEIEKLYFSNYYYSPFKMIKRMFSLARNQRDVHILSKIIPILSSDVSYLYQIKSEIDVILLILEKVKSPPMKTIKNELDLTKGRLVNILQFSDEEMKKMLDIIDECIEINNKEQIFVFLNHLNNKYIKPKINYLTISYLNTVNLNPPPYELLPPSMTYAYRKRVPDENPKILI